jgi:hypothetical protein
MYKCEIDGAEFDTEHKLHSHISRKLKTKLELYYYKYFPRKDLFSGEPIKFKDKPSYFSSFFNSRENLVAFYGAGKSTQSKSVEIIRGRADYKALEWAPSTVECRLSVLPSPLLMERNGLDFNAACRAAGLKERFDYSARPKLKKHCPRVVLYDSREQAPLKLLDEMIKAPLDFGDYTCRSNFNKVFIERKSLSDLCGTLSNGFERFQRELERVRDAGCYLVIGVEEPISSLSKIGKTTSTKFVPIPPELVQVRVKEISQQFQCAQFLFCENRAKLALSIERIFDLTEAPYKMDIQYLHDIGAI